jgi:hypothetical protein
LEQALKLYRERYNDFDPAFAAEKMAEEEGFIISVRVLRRFLITTGEYKRSRNAREYCSRREWREYFGELEQFDGSHHKWFEGERPSCCLITMIDDATGKHLSRFFAGNDRRGNDRIVLLDKELWHT